jgi:hypothetical protein
MPEQRQVDELKSLRDLLDRLQSGELQILRNGQDVTASEVAILKREVSFLNAVIVWLKSGGQSTSAGPKGPSA